MQIVLHLVYILLAIKEERLFILTKVFSIFTFKNKKHVPCFYGVIETWKFGRTRNAVGTRVLKLDRKLRKRE